MIGPAQNEREGGHLGRLTAEETSIAPDVPQAGDLADDIFVNGHELRSRPRRISDQLALGAASFLSCRSRHRQMAIEA